MRSLLYIIVVLIMLSGCSSATHQVVGIKDEPESVSIAYPGTESFQPHSTQKKSALEALGFVYEPLFYITKSNEVIYVLAQDIQKREESFDIYLKQDVLWHDGDAFTAEDVAYTINLVAQGQSTYKCPAIKKALVRSELCITVEFARDVDNPCTLLTFPIIKKDSVCQSTEPVGTGPYCFYRRNGVDSFSFMPYRSYHGESPGFDEIRFIKVPDHEQEYTLFKSGQTDVFYVDNSTLTWYMPSAGSKTIIFPTKHMVMVGLNCISLPESVRRSVYLITDKQNLIENSFLKTAVAIEGPKEYNVAAAHEEIQAGGFVKSGGRYCSIAIVVQEDSRYKTLAELFVRELEDFGIGCNVVYSQSSFDEFATGRYDMVIGGRTLDDGLWEIAGPGNFLMYENKYLQQMILESGDMVDINNILRRDVPFIPLGYCCDAVAVKEEYIDGLSPLEGFAYYGFKSGREK